MSIRTLVEINHDFTWRMDDPDFVASLQGYLSGGSSRCAEALERFGLKIVAQRHHSGQFVIPDDADGFKGTNP